MTTFADREHAIEAHYALLELTAFRDRGRRHKWLGFRLAALTDLRDADARRFALQFAERYAVEPSDEAVYSSVASELVERGVYLSAADIRRMAFAGDGKAERVAHAVASPRLSWVAFVTTELLSLFDPHHPEPAPLPAPAAPMTIQ